MSITEKATTKANVLFKGQAPKVSANPRMGRKEAQGC